MDVLKTSSYDFILSDDFIATKPVCPPDSARLLVYNRATDEISHNIFRDLPSFLDSYTLVLNDTKVIKARIFGAKSTGGQVELLINKPLPNNQFLVYIRGKVKVGTKISFDLSLVAEIIKLFDDGSRIVSFFSNDCELDFSSLIKILDIIGHIPLPPYIDREDEKSDETDYQTLFAKNEGSVAAPTASLHFTPELLEEINQKFGTSFITLHVGAGTFKPVDVDDIKEHKMHSEYFEIDDKTRQIIESDKKILAVGTTVTRTIEYYVRNKISVGECDLFLNPLNKPQRVDSILTNFHLPKSTLIMLVASFVGLPKTLEIYNEAIKNNYRFYSYGDAMLIL